MTVPCSRARRGLATGLALSLALSACGPRLAVAPLESQGLQVTAVSKAPSGFTPDVGSVERKALWQAARATLDSGHRYFRIVGRDLKTRKAGGYGLGLVGNGGRLNTAGSGGNPLGELAAILILIVIDLTIYAITYSDATAEVLLEIRMAPFDSPPHAEEGLFDAAAIIEHWPDLSGAASSINDI